MSEIKRGKYSASAPALGYLYQVRYALVDSLRRLRKGQEFIITIETLDDVVFEKDGSATELIQTKHRLVNPTDLTDSSPDLWKTLRIWCEARSAEIVPEGSLYFLITTAKSADGHAAHYLKNGESRDPDKARQRLNSIAATSSSKENAQAYKAYLNLSQKQRGNLMENIFVIQEAPNISNLDDELKEMSFGFAPKELLEPFIQRLEGWWNRRVIKHLVDDNANPILSEELDSETISLSMQLKQDSLPIDDEIMSASVDASGYQDRYFVHQLELIEISNSRIVRAIQNYFRAFKQRSRWIREELLLVGEMERYERNLIEEWNIRFDQMRDKLGEKATDKAQKIEAKALYEWVESAAHKPIRSGVSEPTISRGTYQILSDSQQVGWHLEFEKRLRHLLGKKETV